MAPLLASLAVALASCAHETTAPVQYGSMTLQVGQPGAVNSSSGTITLARVHVLLTHANGSVALDTTVNLPVNASGVTLTLRAALLPGVPAGGETMNLTVEYMSAAGVILFRGGPISVKVTPVAAGSPGAPATVAVAYVGPGALAARVRIAPRSGTAPFGGTFTFTADAQDAAGATIPNTPVVWYSLDPSVAFPGSPVSGIVTAHQAGAARIVAQLLTGSADTVTLTVQPAASASAHPGAARVP